ncbi:hypothetical protein B0A55_02284 [Friedmanniomyces simplex]|uniref:Cytochrome b561 domain-containing protein n=1 Tax=Friedmanniomyces simplex TaxID=329884 RepID=A0A4U0XXM8_9PEZI|nr:hypothetical protein B0A55_02284 [Friedmanniomyces simplex]
MGPSVCDSWLRNGGQCVGKSLTSTHQLLGLLLLAFILIQFGLGLTHHLLFKRYKANRSHPPAAYLRKLHLILGPATIVLALVNGGLGLNLAGDTSARIPYTIVVAVLGIGFLLVRGYLYLFQRAAAPYAPDEEVLEQYRRTNSFGVGSLMDTGSPFGVRGKRKGDLGGGYEYEGVAVPVPEAYHEGQTPASAFSGGSPGSAASWWSRRPWEEGVGMTVVSVASSTLGWEVSSSGPGPSAD